MKKDVHKLQNRSLKSMQSLLLLLLVISFVHSALVTNAPSASDLDGVHILIDNDIDSSTNHTSIILLSKKRNYQDSVKACESLGEDTYSVSSSAASHLALSNLLKITPVAEAEVKASERYWIRDVAAPKDITDCSSIDRNGKVSKMRCDSQYPILCSNSAPRRLVTPNNPEGDTSRQIRVPTENLGTLQGHRDSTAFRFYGIRYAEPPVGVNRFAAPKPLSSQDNNMIVDANTFGNVCTQMVTSKMSNVADKFMLGADQSEDCLYLNVFTPTLKTNSIKGIPVMVYFHGGSYTTFSGTSPVFEPGNLVSRGGVVVVTLNYRLSIFGLFQNQPAIPKSAAPGNLPTRDQIAALQWVQKNIATFGGDPDQVTIFGESAGGWSIRALLSAPSAFGLYKNAISQSDPMDYPFSGPDFAAEISIRTLQELNCTASDLACAQSKTTAQISAAQVQAIAAVKLLPGNEWVPPSAIYRPCVDGDLIPANFDELVQQRRYNTRANILWGSVATEFGFFVASLFPNPIPTSANSTEILLTFNSDTARLQKLITSPYYQFNSADNDTVRDRLATAGTDLDWTCPYRAFSSQMARRGSTVYTYQINHGRSIANALGAPTVPTDFCTGKTCHSDDVVPSFGSGDVVAGVAQTGDDARFSRQVIDRFSTFARTGDPNPRKGRATGLAGMNTDVTETLWQRYSPVSNNVLQMNVGGSSISKNMDQGRCAWVGKYVEFDYQLYAPEDVSGAAWMVVDTQRQVISAPEH